MRDGMKLAILAGILLIALGEPVYWYIASIEEMFMGLPFNVVWLIICSIATSLVLFILHKRSGAQENEDP